jgi:NADPH:quinone reductase
MVMMRAWQVVGAGHPSDVLRQVEVPVPVPGPGEVLLQVEAAGIGKPDAFLCRGNYAFAPPLPFIPGQEICGKVVAVGDGVSVRTGERYMGVTNFFDGRGGLAEFTIATESTLFRVPESMPASEAATFRIGYSTALIGLQRRGQLREGETVVVLGASGGSGITAVQVASALGARVIAVVSGTEKEALCQLAGAAETIDRTSSDVVAAINKLTSSFGADLVYDPVGGELADSMVNCLAIGGRHLAVGFASGSWANPSVAQLVRRNASLVGVYAGTISRADNEDDHEALLSMYSSEKFTSFVHEVAFDNAIDAVIAVDEGSVVGKSAVVISREEGKNESA